MDEDRRGLALAGAGLAAVFGSLAVPSPTLAVLAYPLLGAAAWLLIRDEVSRGSRVLGALVLGVVAILFLASEHLAIGIRGRNLAHLVVSLDGLFWGSLLRLTPLGFLGAALVVRTRSWGRASAGASLALAGVALLLASRVLPVSVPRQAKGFGVFPVLAAILLAVAWWGRDTLDAREGPARPRG